MYLFYNLLYLLIIYLFPASCKLDPRWSSEGGTLKRVQDTMVEWLVECWLNGYKHVTHLPVSDFFIGWPASWWSTELIDMAVHNHVCSLYVGGRYYNEGKIHDILNSVTAFNSIQKLWLDAVSDIFVVQIVAQHQHSLRVRPETWRHLECVTLQFVTMSGDIVCSLVDYILQLPKSVKVSLKHCTVSHVRLWVCSIRQRTRGWKSYIQSHPRLTVDVDNAIGTNVKLLQFHTNNV